MRNRTMVGVGAILAVIMFPLLAAANPGIVVVPEQYDFGEVEVGAGASTQIEIGNDWWDSLSILSVTLLQGAGTDFSLLNPPDSGTDIPPGSKLVFGVEFSPAAEGLVNAIVEIQWANGEVGTSTVHLSGTGVAASGPVTIEDILAFFDAGVEAGTIDGKGPGCSDKAHLKVFKFKLLMVAFFIDQGWDKGACKLLWHAYARSDGQRHPKDWIDGGPNGDDVPELNTMILELLTDMGCL